MNNQIINENQDTEIPVYVNPEKTDKNRQKPKNIMVKLRGWFNPAVAVLLVVVLVLILKMILRYVKNVKVLVVY